MCKELFKIGEILSITKDYVTLFYCERSQQTVELLTNNLGDLPYHIHKPEGAIFLWLWLKGRPISNQDLYERLKQRRVLGFHMHKMLTQLNVV